MNRAKSAPGIPPKVLYGNGTQLESACGGPAHDKGANSTLDCGGLYCGGCLFQRGNHSVGSRYFFQQRIRNPSGGLTDDRDG